MKLIAAVLVLFAAAGAFGSWNINTDYACANAAGCTRKQFLGQTKLSNGAEVAALTDGLCCGNGRSGYCYDDTMQKCVQQDDMPDPYRFVVCPLKGSIGCGKKCCNAHRERCEVYTEQNGYVQANCVLRFDNAIGFWTIGLPAILVLFTLLALVGTVLILVPRTEIFAKSERLVIAISVLAVLLGIPFFFSTAWQYGVIIVTSALLGLLSLGTGFRPAAWLCAYVQVALFLAMLGWGTGNVLWGSWGEGILGSSRFGAAEPSNPIRCSARYGGWFARTAGTSYRWTNANATARMDENPSLIGMNWGYCDRDWYAALYVFGIVGIAFSAMGVVGHLISITLYGRQ